MNNNIFESKEAIGAMDENSVYLNCEMPENPKVEGLTAGQFGLFVLSLFHSSQMKSHGEISEVALKLMGSTPLDEQVLVDRNLWKRLSEKSYRIVQDDDLFLGVL